MSSLEQSDKEAAAVAVAPRVSLADIEAAIAERYDVRAGDAVGGIPTNGHPLDRLSICILVMRNGFVVIDTSAPASAANFNAELGTKLAYEDCIRQLWKLMGFALRDRLSVPPNLLEELAQAPGHVVFAPRSTEDGPS